MQSKEDRDNLYTARVIKFDQPTVTHKIYTREAFCTEENVTLLDEMVRSKSCFIECGSSYDNTMTMDMSKVAGLVESVEFSDEGVDVSYKLLDTACGNMVKKLMEAGCPIYISFGGRGELDLNESTGNSTVRDYHFGKFCFTTSPTYIKERMENGRDWE